MGRRCCHVAPWCSHLVYNLRWDFSNYMEPNKICTSMSANVPSVWKCHFKTCVIKITLDGSRVAQNSIKSPENPSPQALLYHTVHPVYTLWKVASLTHFIPFQGPKLEFPPPHPSGRNGEGKGTLRGGSGQKREVSKFSPGVRKWRRSAQRGVKNTSLC